MIHGVVHELSDETEIASRTKKGASRWRTSRTEGRVISFESYRTDRLAIDSPQRQVRTRICASRDAIPLAILHLVRDTLGLTAFANVTFLGTGSRAVSPSQFKFK